MSSYKLTRNLAPKNKVNVTDIHLISYIFAPFNYMLIWDSFFFFSLSRIEQEIHSFTAWLALVGFSFSNLLILVGLINQGSGAALFHEHSAIMLDLIIDAVTFTTALAAWVLAISNRNSPLFFKSVSYFVGFDLWLTPFHPWPNLGVDHLCARCIYSCLFTLWLDFRVLSRKYLINFKLFRKEIQIPITFPSIQRISHAYSQCDREISDGIGRMLDERLSIANGGRSRSYYALIWNIISLVIFFVHVKVVGCEWLKYLYIYI